MLIRLIPPCFALILSAGCGPDAATADREPAGPETYFPVPIDDVVLHVQLALSPDEQERGLMHRDSLPPDHGMLFLNERPGKRSFWMRNTRIPLDLAYFDKEGVLRELHQLYPLDERSVVSRSDRIQIAVEANQGWFAAHDLGPGDRLDLGALADALRRRDIDPERYNLPISE